MDNSLVLLAKNFWLEPSNWWAMAQVLLGLGFVIFVHELGHFLVAKACGVKCEKFYVGFDAFDVKIGDLTLIPRSLVKWQWGETEYGIGIVPLGGYVKMLGQDDNPGNIEEENRRSMADPNAGVNENLPEGFVDKTTLDPRSFKAKSVPQRMAIISAGVIFNLIFAVILAAIAFRSGVDYNPIVIGGVTPGGPAWEEDISGVTVTRIGDKEVEGYFPFIDLIQEVVMNGGDKPLDFEIIRPGSSAKELVQLTPVKGLSRNNDYPLIGVQPASMAKLSKEDPIVEGEPAAAADPPFMNSDTITDINGIKVESSYDLRRALAINFDQQATFRLQRADGEDGSAGPSVSTVVETNPRRELGLVMKWKPVAAIQKGSPAAEAGFQVNDVILKIDGQPRGDLLTLDQRMTRIARDNPRSVEFLIKREGEEMVVKAKPRLPRVISMASEDHPIAVDTLGLAIKLGRTVEDILPNSPMENLDVETGDEIVSFQYLLDKDQKKSERFTGIKTGEIDLTDDLTGWGELMETLQQLAVGTQVKLGLKRDSKVIEHEVSTFASPDHYRPARGIQLTMLQNHYISDSWSESFVLGYRQTVKDASRVWEFLVKLVKGRISPKALGGPGTIALAATSEATAGTSRLLLFLTLLSANLAIVNFLPIPILDGGHMLFLAYEGIFRRPVTERVYIALAYLGLFMLLGLMLFVILMDATRIYNLFQ